MTIHVPKFLRHTSRQFDEVNISSTYDPDGDRSRGANRAEDQRLEVGILRMLHFFYPGHPFVAKVNSSQGMAYIGLPSICLDWYKVKLSTLFTQHGFDRLKIVAGEFLERYNLPRSAARTDDYQQMKHDDPRIWLKGVRS